MINLPLALGRDKLLGREDLLIGRITRLVRVIYSTLGAKVSLDIAYSPIRVLRVLRGTII